MMGHVRGGRALHPGRCMGKLVAPHVRMRRLPPASAPATNHCPNVCLLCCVQHADVDAVRAARTQGRLGAARRRAAGGRCGGGGG